MSRPALYLLAASAACVALGYLGLVAAWRDPDSVLATAGASAGGWPWLLAALLGARSWQRGRARSADPFEHFLAVYAAGTASALAAATLTILAGGWEFSALPCPSGPLAAPCAALLSMGLAAAFAGLTLGFAFPALLPVAAAALSARLLAGRPPSGARLAAAIAATAGGWLAAAFAGLALAHA